jgi:hypothetical protein
MHGISIPIRTPSSNSPMVRTDDAAGSASHGASRARFLTKEVAMKIRKRRSDRSGRPPLSSPGRPPMAGRGARRRFWGAIAAGMASEDAAIDAGISPPVGTRWVVARQHALRPDPT